MPNLMARELSRLSFSFQTKKHITNFLELLLQNDLLSFGDNKPPKLIPNCTFSYAKCLVCNWGAEVMRLILPACDLGEAKSICAKPRIHRFA